ncbi:amino acid adenylation domain-containing protein [Mastigocladus laminosus UU774]|nr:amino acid adenylation domain-containing protein [Mastigocladus laminosus UU774]
MKTTEEFLSYLCSLDVKLWVEDSRLRCNAPKDALTTVIKEELAERKEDILAFLRKNSVDVAADKQPISPVKRQGNLPLSFAQQRLWFTEQFTQVCQVFDTPTISCLKGSLNIAALESAINEIVRRHEILRTSFTLVEGKPVQVIHPTLSLSLPIVDLQKLPEVEREVEIQRLIGIEASKCFNLTEIPLLWCILIKSSEKEHIVFFIIHHIITDGWSVGIFNSELTTLYEAFSQNKPSPLPELPIQYADFAIWQRQYLQGKILDNLLTYWKQKLSGSLPVLQLPIDYPRPAIQTFSGKRKTFFLSADLTEALKTLSRNEDATIFMTLLAAFKTLLYRYTGQDDIVVGSPIANRNQDGIEQLIGFFVNTLVLRTNCSGNPSFKELLRRVRETTLGAYAHQDMPFELLVDELQIQRNLSYTPLFQVMFVLHNAPISEVEMAGLTFGSVESGNNNLHVMFDLILHITETGGGIDVWLDYNTDLFEENTICQMASHLQTLLSEIVANPQLNLSDLPLLTEPERQTLLFNWNNTATDYPQDTCIHELFEEQVEKTPDAIALIFENQQLSYRELNRRANQLARYLQQLGVKPEVLVGICVERSLSMVIGLLAILKAGGAYVPLDPSYPQEHLAYMLEDSQPGVLLTQQYLLENISNHKAQVICIDSDWEKIANENTDNPISNITLDNLAYVIYTSGSTGKPKGAMNAHSGILNRLLWMQQTYQLTSADAVLQKTPFSFDVSVWEFFWTLITGARLVVAQPEGHKDTNYLVNLIAQQQITTLHFVPSMLQVFIEAEGLEKCQSLVRIIASGEALPAQLQQRFFNKLDAQLHNLYGPTEAAVDVTFWQCEKDGVTHQNTVPIGQPIANIQIYLLDQYLNPVPVGITGEVYIGGVGVGRGYLNRPELTAEKFIPNPFSQQTERLYKTGDKARYLANGEIEYIGRIDNQIKLRGFRIELGEIEAIISQYQAVRETVVVVREESEDSKRIVAYVVPQTEQTLTIPELRSFLESKLPSYMVPAAFVTLEALPLTPNGKVDRRALPTPELTRVLSSNIVSPSTPIENLLAGIWAEILGIDKVGINNNFFELGGHSLIATRVISQIREIFQVELPLSYLFEKPTIAGLAKEIEKAIKVNLGVEATNIERIERSQQLPLSFAQTRLWFLDQLEPNNTAYNIFNGIHLSGTLNIGALEQSFNEIVRRHEALRTSFQTVDGQPIQIIAPTLILTFPIVDLCESSPSEREKEIHRLATQEVLQPFDLAQCPLLRVTLIRLNAEEHIILLTMHHIISDAWSMGVLVEEVAALYPAFCTGRLSQLPELPIQYADFAVWQRQWLQGEVLQTQLDYWKQQLGNTSPRLTLPKPPLHSTIETRHGAKQSFTLSQDLTQAINLLSRQEGVTLFMTLLAVFQVLLYCFTGTEDIRIGSPIANRNRVEIEKLIGFFINTLVLRIDLSGNPSFRELLVRSRQVTLEAYAHQDLPFEKLVEELQPERSINHNPLHQAWFVLQNTPMPQLELPDLTLTPLEVESGTARHDLLLTIWESPEGLNGTFEYKTNLFDKASISQLIRYFETLARHIVAQPDTTLNELATMLAQIDEEQQQIQKQELQTAERQKLKTSKRKAVRN